VTNVLSSIQSAGPPLGPARTSRGGSRQGRAALVLSALLALCFRVEAPGGALVLYATELGEVYQVAGYAELEARGSGGAGPTWNVYGSGRITGAELVLSLTAQSWAGTRAVHAAFAADGTGIMSDAEIGAGGAILPAALGTCR